MLLYTCKACGRWQDVSLTKYLTDFANNLSRGFNGADAIEQNPGYPCPAGHGLMEQVQMLDRIFVKPSEVEALPEEANK